MRAASREPRAASSKEGTKTSCTVFFVITKQDEWNATLVSRGKDSNSVLCQTVQLITRRGEGRCGAVVGCLGSGEKTRPVEPAAQMQLEAEVQGPLESIRFGDGFPFDASIYIYLKQISFYG